MPHPLYPGQTLTLALNPVVDDVVLADTNARIRAYDQAFVDVLAVAAGISRGYRYVPAVIDRDRGVVVPAGLPMTIEQAAKHVKGLPKPSDPNYEPIHGVMTITRQDASNLAEKLGGIEDRKNGNPEIHGYGAPGFFYHFHPASYPHTHIWFLRLPWPNL